VIKREFYEYINRYELVCNSKSEWVGQWPVCVPIVTCSKEEILRDNDSSVLIEQIGNVYYLNSTQWYAINDSWIRYKCQKDDHIMVGKGLRTCMKNGKWSNKSPTCTGESMSNKLNRSCNHLETY